MVNRIKDMENELERKRQSYPLYQKDPSTSISPIGAGLSWRVRALSDQSFDLRFSVPLVPQQTGMSCWAAGAAMVVAWREHYSADPAQIAQAAGAWAAYSAGLHPESTAIFPIWGLTPEPPQAYTVDGFRQLLETYGPLWVAGAVPGPHIRVVTGMHGDGSPEGTKVLINDPWQQGMTTFTLPNAGAQYEETYSQFVAETERLARQEAASFPRAIYVARSTRPRAPRVQARSLNGFARANGARRTYPVVPTLRAYALSIPVDFDVPRIVLSIRKPSQMTCWAAATAMLVSYKEGKPVSVEEAVRRAGGRYEQLLHSDAALAKADMADYLSALGLASQPAADLSVEQVEQMLRRFGAVWLTLEDDATFSRDARIVTGIHGDGTPHGTQLVLLDPGTGTAAPVAFDRLKSVFAREALSNPTGHLLAIYWPPDTLGDRPPVRAFNAVAIAGLGWSVFQGIGNNKGDIEWSLQRMDGAKHPWDQKDKYENIGRWQKKTVRVSRAITWEIPLTGVVTGELSAAFELTFQYNGHSVGFVSIHNVNTNDELGGGMKVEATIMPDPNSYRVNNVEPIAAVEVTFNFRFTYTLENDDIYLEKYLLFGNGQFERNGRWTQ
jgi:hypothetical protein